MKQLGFYDIEENPFHDWDRMQVLVEWKKALTLDRIVNCYVPAFAIRKGDTITLCYERYIDSEPYRVWFAYDKYNYPPLYDFVSMGIRECLLVSIGTLLGYDEEEKCFRPFLDHNDENGQPVCETWWDIEQLKDNWKKC